MEIVEILRENPQIENILRDCPYDILKKWEVEYYEKDDVICYQNQIYDYFYIIIYGNANICIHSENGKKHSQAIYGPGSYFGELEIFDRKLYIASIESMGQLKLMKLPRVYFLDWIRRDSHFLFHITKTLCDSFYDLSKLSGENTLYSLKYRVCSYLVYKASALGDRPKSMRIKLDKETLSERFAVTQRSINRILKDLKEDKIIDINGSYINILDFERLLEAEEVSKTE